MVELVARSNDRGEWYSARHESLAAPVLSAHRPSPVAEEFTLYWRGRVDAMELNDFFASTLPNAEYSSVSAQMFTPAGKIRLDRLSSRGELKEKLPPDAQFLRLEFLARPDRRTPFDPAFIVWSRVDLQHIAPGRAAPDDIGVYMGIPHMARIFDALRPFIEHTHIFHPAQSLIQEALEKLAERTSQAASPLASS